MKMEPSSHGLLPPPNNFIKCSSNSNISAPLEGEDKEMGGAAMPAVATEAEEAEEDTSTSKAVSSSKTKVSRGREANSKTTSLCSGNTKDLVVCTTMEDADKDSSSSEEEEQGACARYQQIFHTAGLTGTL